MQDLAHFHINDEVVLVLRRLIKGRMSEQFKIRKSGKLGQNVDYIAVHFTEHPKHLELLKNGTVIEL